MGRGENSSERSSSTGSRTKEKKEKASRENEAAFREEESRQKHVGRELSRFATLAKRPANLRHRLNRQ